MNTIRSNHEQRLNDEGLALHQTQLDDLGSDERTIFTAAFDGYLRLSQTNFSDLGISKVRAYAAVKVLAHLRLITWNSGIVRSVNREMFAENYGHRQERLDAIKADKLIADALRSRGLDASDPRDVEEFLASIAQVPA